MGKAKSERAGKLSQKISVLDLEKNETIFYGSISTAARALGIRQSVISLYFRNDQNSLYKGRYIFVKSSDF